MRLLTAALLLALAIFAAPTFAATGSSPLKAEGVVTVKSKFSVIHTVDRLKTILTKKGMTIFAEVNHAKGAKSVGIDIPPTQLIIFGNPKVGAPLVSCSRSIAIDLPQKMLIWQDRAKQVWLSYNDPVYIADRHSVSRDCRKSLGKIAGALAAFSTMAGGIE